jgi:hypothetical protein
MKVEIILVYMTILNFLLVIITKQPHGAIHLRKQVCLLNVEGGISCSSLSHSISTSLFLMTFSGLPEDWEKVESPEHGTYYVK